jgi:hypothetical protein
MKFSWQRSSSGLALLAGIVGAAPTFAAQSSAHAVSAEITVDGSRSVQLAPMLGTAGRTTLGQSFDLPLSSALLAKSVILAPAGQRGSVLTVVAQSARTDAAGSGGVDVLSATGSSSAAAGLLTLQASAASARPVLQLQFSKLKAGASYSRIVPSAAKRSGNTNFGSLTIGGTWVGQVLSAKGDVAPNTILLDTPTVKITLNAQSIPQQPVCSPGLFCPAFQVLETVDTKAVLIELNQAPVNGRSLSGRIVIGAAQAGE